MTQRQQSFIVGLKVIILFVSSSLKMMHCKLLLFITIQNQDSLGIMLLVKKKNKSFSELTMQVHT